MNNQNAFAAGTAAGKVRAGETDFAFGDYRDACAADIIQPSISASVCFVAGFKGNGYPSHDERVTS